MTALTDWPYSHSRQIYRTSISIYIQLTENASNVRAARNCSESGFAHTESISGKSFAGEISVRVHCLAPTHFESTGAKSPPIYRQSIMLILLFCVDLFRFDWNHFDFKLSTKTNSLLENKCQCRCRSINDSVSSKSGLIGLWMHESHMALSPCRHLLRHCQLKCVSLVFVCLFVYSFGLHTLR